MLKRYLKQSMSRKWERTLFILVVCQFFAMGGMSALIPFLPLFIRELGIATTNEIAIWSGIVFAGPFVTALIAQPMWGALGDKRGRKPMVVRALLGLSIAQVLIYFVPNVYWLLGMRLLQGTLSGYNVAAMSLITAIAPKERQGYSISLLQSASNGGVVIGPVIGGLLSEILGFRGVFLVVGLAIALLAVVVIMFVDKDSHAPDKEEEIRVRDNIRTMLNDRVLLGTASLILLTSLGISSLRPIFVLYIESFNLPTEYSLAFMAGSLYSILGIFSTISSAYFGKIVDTAVLRKVLGFASLGTGLMYVLHPFITNVYLLIPARTVLGLCYGVIVPVLFTKISTHASGKNKGGILALAMSSQTLGVIFGSILSGNLVNWFGVRYPFLIIGVFFLSIFAITPFLRND